ncbi:oxaloacetate-decarboxylating malate dehydrogenase [Microbacterium sediminicola]|uniref:Oxaloacetate-decarboxylating malate dehydrogenase n=1 Tax=Microbacterium sediminicola TaxID=415210 RepID=A0ABP4UGV5_9MICO
MPEDVREQTLDTGETAYVTSLRGGGVLRHPLLNKGSAFTAEERSALGLSGLLPDLVSTDMEQQLSQAYAHYSGAGSDLDKHVYMWDLHDTNVTLFYALIQRHLLEMLPVVYDPTVGEAIEKFSEIMRRPRGVYLSIDHAGTVEERLTSYRDAGEDIDLIVASDAEEILGIGDWAANGIDISIGKLAVYTAAAGVNPHRVIPVVLDVGTNNEKLLNDPAYIGVRHSRVRGEQYDAFIDEYVTAAKRLFPQALLHWEDFGSTTARVILDRYRDEVPTFNDDMQGTGAIALAGLINAVTASGTRWADHKVVVLGAGTAGCGIADQIAARMQLDGATEEQARQNIHLVDLPGLLTDDMVDGLLDYQKPYAQPAAASAAWERTPVQTDVAASLRWPAMGALREGVREKGMISLAAVVENVKPSILIGTSTTPGMFTEEIVRTMAAAHAHPILFPLSNPTPLAEATPAQILGWSNGAALVATGSPFDDVELGGVTHKIGQANNAALYPGLGFGAIVSRATKVTDEMIYAAAEAVASQAEMTEPGDALLPSNARLRETSALVAVQVAKTAVAQGVNGVELSDPVQAVHEAAWWPEYRAVVAG